LFSTDTSDVLAGILLEDENLAVGGSRVKAVEALVNVLQLKPMCERAIGREADTFVLAALHEQLGRFHGVSLPTGTVLRRFPNGTLAIEARGSILIGAS
jgi:hypothetical protein